jgi:hypothetical protein
VEIHFSDDEITEMDCTCPYCQDESRVLKVQYLTQTKQRASKQNTLLRAVLFCLGRKMFLKSGGYCCPSFLLCMLP